MRFSDLRRLLPEEGFTLAGVLVALTILSLALIGLIPLYTLTAEVSNTSQAKLVASNLANRELERIRAIDYDDVGTVSGNPNGILNPDYNEQKNGLDFHIKTRVKWVDGDFDGAFPDDQDPRDYKQVTLTVSWEGVFSAGNEVEMMTYVSRESEERVETGGNILVTVIDTEGNPLEDVRVDVTTGPSSPIWDETDENGQVLFPMLDPSEVEGDYTVTATKTNWICRPDTANQTPTVIANETRNLQFIMGQPAVLIVHLIDPLGNLVGKNSRITLSSAESGTQEYTSHDGDFTISDLFPGSYDLTAWAASYESTPEAIAIDVPPNQTTEINVTLYPRPSGHIHLNVFDAGGNPMGPANVRITNVDTAEVIDTQTNGTGVLEIQVEEGTYTVEVSMEGCQTQSHTIDVEASGNTFLDVYMDQAVSYGSILVRCERYSGSPRNNIRVRVVGTGYDQEQQTGDYAPGEALFENLSPGDYIVYRWSWGWRFPQNVTVVAGQQQRVTYRW